MHHPVLFPTPPPRATSIARSLAHTRVRSASEVSSQGSSPSMKVILVQRCLAVVTVGVVPQISSQYLEPRFLRLFPSERKKNPPAMSKASKCIPVPQTSSQAKAIAFFARQMGNASCNPEWGIYGTKSEKLTKQGTRGYSLFCKPFRRLQGKFKSFLVLTAEKKSSVRTHSEMTACEQGGKGLVDHSEACQ